MIPGWRRRPEAGRLVAFAGSTLRRAVRREVVAALSGDGQCGGVADGWLGRLPWRRIAVGFYRGSRSGLTMARGQQLRGLRKGRHHVQKKSLQQPSKTGLSGPRLEEVSGPAGARSAVRCDDAHGQRCGFLAASLDPGKRRADSPHGLRRAIPGANSWRRATSSSWTISVPTRERPYAAPSAPNSWRPVRKPMRSGDDVSVLMKFLHDSLHSLSSEAGCPVVMTLWVTRSQRSHDGRNACAGGMREWCGRRERSD